MSVEEEWEKVKTYIPLLGGEWTGDYFRIWLNEKDRIIITPDWGQVSKNEEPFAAVIISSIDVQSWGTRCEFSTINELAEFIQKTKDAYKIIS